MCVVKDTHIQHLSQKEINIQRTLFSTLFSILFSANKRIEKHEIKFDIPSNICHSKGWKIQMVVLGTFCVTHKYPQLFCTL